MVCVCVHACACVRASVAKRNAKGTEMWLAVVRCTCNAYFKGLYSMLHSATAVRGFACLHLGPELKNHCTLFALLFSLNSITFFVRFYFANMILFGTHRIHCIFFKLIYYTQDTRWCLIHTCRNHKNVQLAW